MGGIGYNILRRQFSTSASSDKRTTGSPSTVSRSEGWGRENMSPKKGDDMDNTNSWTRKLIKSQDWIIISPLAISKRSGRGEEFCGKAGRGPVLV